MYSCFCVEKSVFTTWLAFFFADENGQKKFDDSMNEMKQNKKSKQV